MDINKYALFVDVADTKNFTKSGERMGYTQPGVSHILKVMEAELGFSLFQRTKQGVVLTRNAEIILPLVRNLLAVNEQLQQTISSINGLKTGHLTIASFASIARNWLPAVIYAFQQEYPGIEIELMEGGTDDIVDWVKNNQADFGLLSRRNSHSLKWIPLYEDPLMAIIPKDYELPKDHVFPIEQLNEQPFIISAAGVDYDIHHYLEEAGISPNIRFSSKDDLAIVSMVANHLGISILPKLIIEGLENEITALPLKPFASRELGIGIHASSSLSPAAKYFIETIEKTLPQLLDQSS